MNVSVRLFARAKDLAASGTVVVEVPAGATVGEVRRCLAEARPILAAIVGRSAFAVNGEFANDDQVMPPAAEVALLPPVSGG
jgi:molybdopterin converting factor small subunit